jgi:ubiquinone biosynthesis protein
MRLRLALESLGPVFVKFGQMLSTRRDLLSPDMADQLAVLQDRVTPFDATLASERIKQALGLTDLQELFSEFEMTPLASASIAQVHGARLKADNAEVVVKVTRPDIERTIKADIRLMMTVAGLLQKWLPDGRRLRPVEVVNEYRKTILDELDLFKEAANGMQLARNFKDSPALYVPHIYSEHCRESVLVMERIDGIPISNIDALQAQETNFKLLAERGVELFFTQVFRDSFFHADMHPGNILVSRVDPHSPQYIAIDFGIVGTLNSSDKRYLAENILAFFNRDYRKVAQLHVDSGWVPADTNVDAFDAAIRTVCEPIFQKKLADISFGQVLMQLFNVARQFNMQVQPQLVLLQKTLLYVEGLGRQLYPDLDLWETAKPFLEKWMREQIGVKATFKRIAANAPYWSEKFSDVPDLIYESLQQTKQLPVHLQALQAQQLAEQRKQHLSQKWLLAGSTLLLLAAVLSLNSQLEWVWSLVSGSLGLACWLVSLKK